MNFPNIGCDPDMPEDEIRLVTPTQIVRMVNVGKLKAVEPDAVEKMPKGYSLSIDEGIGTDKGIMQVYDTRTNTLERKWVLDQYLSVSPLMRRLGYTRNPHDCLHFRKRMYLGMTRFQCSDCGELL